VSESDRMIAGNRRDSRVLAGLITRRDGMAAILEQIEAGHVPSFIHPASSPTALAANLRSEIQVLETRIAWVRLNTEQKGTTND
jgi:hypothetical protein